MERWTIGIFILILLLLSSFFIIYTTVQQVQAAQNNEIATGCPTNQFATTESTSGVFSCGVQQQQIIGNCLANAVCYSIILENQQSKATAVNLQILIRMNWVSYPNLAANIQNVEFTDSSLNLLRAWCEGNCTSSSNSSIIWIKDDASILSGANQTILLNIFYPSSTNEYSSSGFWGAYPTFTGTYGQYDNAPLVFTWYNNFNGSSLPSSINATKLFGASSIFIVNNGLFTSSVSVGGYVFSKTSNFSTPYVLDSYFTKFTPFFSSPSSGAFQVIPFQCMTLCYGGSHTGYFVRNAIGSPTSFNIFALANTITGNLASGNHTSLDGVLSLNWNSTGKEYANYNYTSQSLSSIDNAFSIRNNIPSIEVINTVPVPHNIENITVQWFRTRLPPPSNIMPLNIFSFQPIVSPSFAQLENFPSNCPAGQFVIGLTTTLSCSSGGLTTQTSAFFSYGTCPNNQFATAITTTTLNCGAQLAVSTEVAGGCGAGQAVTTESVNGGLSCGTFITTQTSAFFSYSGCGANQFVTAITTTTLNCDEVADMILVTNSSTCTDTTMTTKVMAGSQVSYTPKGTGNLSVTLNFELASPTTSGLTSKYQFAYGTGKEPVCNAAATGTTLGQQWEWESTGAQIGFTPLSTSVIITGLNAGTRYWFDLQISDSTTASWTYSLPQISVVET